MLEAGQAVIYGKVIENFKVPSPVDAYFETIILPGFSDAHAHPQVIDGGLTGGPWRNSYDWIERRRLVVDEAAIRRDIDLASRLTAAVLKRALLEGTTLIALTGSLEANIRAFMSLGVKPRVVFLPTVMSKRGWPSLTQALEAVRRVSKYLDDGAARVGVFLHSIKYSGDRAVREALTLAASKGLIVGMHLSEGVPEAGRLKSIAGGGRVPGRVVAVHCINDSPQRLGVRCASCPATNLMLYGTTRRSLKGVTSFGSDWPLLIGTVPRHLGLITSVWRRRVVEVLSKATVGGYRDYGIPYTGDLIAFDESLDRVLEGSALPRLVMVSWNIVVDEGKLPWGEGYNDVLREIRSLVREAVERHPSGERLGDPLAEAEASFNKALLAHHKSGVAASLGGLS